MEGERESFIILLYYFTLFFIYFLYFLIILYFLYFYFISYFIYFYEKYSPSVLLRYSYFRNYLFNYIFFINLINYCFIA